MKNYNDIEKKLQDHYDNLLSSVKAPDTAKKQSERKSSKWENIKDFFQSSGMHAAAAVFALICTVGGVYLFIFSFSGKNLDPDSVIPDATYESSDMTDGTITSDGPVTTVPDNTDPVFTSGSTDRENTETEDGTGTEFSDVLTTDDPETVTPPETDEPETDGPYTQTETEAETIPSPVTAEPETDEITTKPQSEVTETDPATETDPVTGENPEETHGYAPAYVKITCGDQQIYPQSYFLNSYVYPEGSNHPIVTEGPGAASAETVPLIKCTKDDTLSIDYFDNGHVDYVHYWRYGKKDKIGVNTNKNFINKFLETAECGVYRFVVAVVYRDGTASEQWEYPFEIEVIEAVYPLTEIDGVIYADHGSYCEVSGHSDNVFENVVIRSSVKFGDKELPVRYIGEKAFSECADIKSVTLPYGIIEIKKQAFWKCSNLQSINLPESIKALKMGAFNSCAALDGVVLPDSLETMDFGVFALCKSLTGITIPDKVTDLSECVFSDCGKLKSVTIGSGVKAIHYRAFEGTYGLESIIISDKNPTYHSKGNCIIETDSKTLIYAADNCVIPDDGSVTMIGDYPFYYRFDLECIEIPASITKLGTLAFTGCTKLDIIYYGGTVSQWESITNGNYTLTYQCEIICSDGKIEPVVETGWE